MAQRGRLRALSREHLRLRSEGNLLWVEGEMHMREYVTRDGIQKKLTEVIANNVQFFRNEPAR